MKAFMSGKIPATMMFPGASKEAGNVLKSMGVTKCCAIYDIGVEKAGITEGIVQAIRDAGIECVTWNKVLPDPPDTSVLEANEFVMQNGCDGIIAIGGGSAMDTAKLTTIAHFMDKKVLEEQGVSAYAYGGLPLPAKQIKLITVPTTSGTGAEGTAGAMITDTKNGAKILVLPENMGTDQSILDPLLQLGLPPHITAACGMDAMAHMIESVIAGSDEWKNTMLMKGIKTVWEWLPIAVAEGGNVEARTRMCFAANIAMAYFYGNSNGHAFAHTLGALYHVPHGDACAASIPAAVRHMGNYDPENLKELASCIGVPSEADNLADRVATALEEFCRKIGLRPLCEREGFDDFDTFVGKMLPYLKEKDFTYNNEFQPPMTDETGIYYLKQMYYGKKPE